MCIIVDINTLSSVFDPSSSDHSQFSPVLKHIETRKSKLIIGGTKFNSELAHNKRFIKILSILNSSRKIAKEDDRAVDQLEMQINARFPESQYPKFNDKHIVALCYTSNARMVCTKDGPLQDYLRRREFYNRNKNRPKIYNQRSGSGIVPTGSFNPKCRLC